MAREDLSHRLLSHRLEARGWRFNISSGAWHAPELSERLRNIARATVGRHFKRMKERRPWHGFHIIDVNDLHLPEDTLIAQLRYVYDQGQPIDRAEIRMSVPTPLLFQASACWWDRRWEHWWKRN